MVQAQHATRQHRSVSYDSAKIAALLAGLILVGPLLAGCAAAREPEEAPSATSAAAPKPDDTPGAEAQPSAAPTPAETMAQPLNQTEYEAEIALWPEPLPPGYSWPAWADLPHVDPYGIGQLGRADNASGVYRCILIDAAWHAYFEANDSTAARDYATRADNYVIPDNPSILPVTQDGIIIDSALATASGICLGIAGDLNN